MNRLHLQQKQFASLPLTAVRQAALDQWADARFVTTALQLEGFAAPDSGTLEPLLSGSLALDVEVAARARTLLTAIRQVRAAASTGSSILTPEFFLRLGRPDENGAGRPAEADANDEKPARRFAIWQNLCAWFSADSFCELHPAEQTAIAYLRILEMRLYEERGLELAAVSVFPIRAGMPPFILDQEHLTACRQALAEATRMNTRPMVELVANSLIATVAEMSRQATSTGS